MPWAYVNQHRLTIEKLKNYLEEQFPFCRIDVHDGGNDYYAVELPSALTQSQLYSIEDLRSGGSDTGSLHAWTAPSSSRQFRNSSDSGEFIELPEPSGPSQSPNFGSEKRERQTRDDSRTIHPEQELPVSAPLHKPFDVNSSRHTAAGTIPSDSGYASLPTISTVAQQAIDSDRLTIKSTVSTVEGDPDVKTALVRAFVDEISSHLASNISNGVEHTEKLEHSVESCLKTFVEVLESIAESKFQMQGALFLRQQRRRISKELLLSLGTTDGSVSSSGNSTSTDRSTYEGMGSDKIMDWLIDQPQWQESVDEEEPQTETHMIHYFEESRAFITQGDAFRWLVDQLTASMTLVGIETISSLNHYILNEFSRHTGSINVEVAQFVIRSRFDLFLRNYYGDRGDYNLGDVLVVIRNEHEHQMLTCREYMRQTWPTSGEATLVLLQKALDAVEQQRLQDTQFCFDGVTARLIIRNDTTSALFCAPRLRLCDIGAQLCWLAAACQYPADNEWVVSSAVLVACSISKGNEFQVNEDHALSFEIDIKKDRIAPWSPSNDNCWQLLLKCSNIISGFPISHRAIHEEGMEIALETMAQLAGARRVTIFDGKIILKGFASLLVAVICDDASMTWHYMESTELARISFSAAKSIFEEHELDLGHLKRKRHFLGWTRFASQEAGTIGANFADIKRSRSEIVCGPRFALSGINLSVSKYLSGGASFALSERENSLRVKREGPFEVKIYSLSRMYVVLYDELRQRGWMVDGASAILHALRCQLAMPPYNKSRYFELSSFKYSESSGGPDVSMEALLDSEFRKMKVFESRSEAGEGAPDAVNMTEKVTYWTIEGMIEDLWDVFEKMHDHQEKLKSAPGIELRFDRDMLEGWSFVDLLSEPVLQARSVRLTPSGRGWVDFTRAIQAVTFLARDFGEIIQPVHRDRSCPIWAQVPHGMDYLAVRLQLLKQICEVYGDPSSAPLKLANGIYWHKAHQLFEECNCVVGMSGETCDRIQVLLPELTLGRKTHPGIDLADDAVLRDAAVIFGRSARLPWHWSSKEAPNESVRAHGSVASNNSLGSIGGTQSPFSTPSPGQSSKSSRSTRFRWPFKRREQ